MVGSSEARVSRISRTSAFAFSESSVAGQRPAAVGVYKAPMFPESEGGLHAALRSITLTGGRLAPTLALMYELASSVAWLAASRPSWRGAAASAAVVTVPLSAFGPKGRMARVGETSRKPGPGAWPDSEANSHACLGSMSHRRTERMADPWCCTG